MGTLSLHVVHTNKKLLLETVVDKHRVPIKGK